MYKLHTKTKIKFLIAGFAFQAANATYFSGLKNAFGVARNTGIALQCHLTDLARSNYQASTSMAALQSLGQMAKKYTQNRREVNTFEMSCLGESLRQENINLDSHIRSTWTKEGTLPYRDSNRQSLNLEMSYLGMSLRGIQEQERISFPIILGPTPTAEIAPTLSQIESSWVILENSGITPDMSEGSLSSDSITINDGWIE
jgi:hypothetical protein